MLVVHLENFLIEIRVHGCLHWFQRSKWAWDVMFSFVNHGRFKLIRLVMMRVTLIIMSIAIVVFVTVMVTVVMSIVMFITVTVAVEIMIHICWVMCIVAILVTGMMKIFRSMMISREGVNIHVRMSITALCMEWETCQ